MTPQEKLRKIVGNNVKTARKEEGLTQGYVGEALGINRKAISRIERGERLPFEQIVALMVFFQVEPIEFFEDWENVWEVEE